MEKKSISTRVIYALTYFSGIVGALVVILADKDGDLDIRFHAFQTLVLVVLNVVCGLGGVVSIVFAIIALVTGNAPTLPLIGEQCKKWAEKK